MTTDITVDSNVRLLFNYIIDSVLNDTASRVKPRMKKNLKNMAFVGRSNEIIAASVKKSYFSLLNSHQ